MTQMEQINEIHFGESYSITKADLLNTINEIQDKVSDALVKFEVRIYGDNHVGLTVILRKE